MKLFSNSYTTIVEFPVKYVHFPTNKVAINYVPTSLAVKVEAYGYDIFTFGLWSDKDSIIIDGRYLEQKTVGGKTYSYISTKALLRKATSNIDSDVLIKELLMDTIPFHFEEKITKTVLVILDLDITYEKQYAKKGTLKMRPEAVQISGPKSLLDSITKLKTKPIRLREVNDDISLTTQVETNDNRIRLQQKSVFVTVEVEKITESEKIIPIEFQNVPAGYSVRTFPGEIKIIYLVGLSDYEEIQESQFKAVVDLNQLEDSPTKLQVRLIRYPKEITITRQDPTSVEYIIKK
ncbi:MAG: YbbR-like domain-containing protein [Flavobacteriales bacterium]|nr:YbbR-like domain-containing protein [Flavobacteriales bacterium]